ENHPTSNGSRFQILRELGEEAVLDQETQLIWERYPSGDGTSWSSAAMNCAVKAIGGRRGWRLPTFFELMSLVDPSVRGTAARPALPTGHPFSSARATRYWSETAVSDDPTKAYVVDFLGGDVMGESIQGKRNYWCVRRTPSEQPPKPFNTNPQMVLLDFAPVHSSS
ncbi:MAG: Lcl C-terminal domain-containing protein, partial [Nitrospiraceae bacterium]